jgi:fibronectin type 3 domain-containing protein
MRRILVFVCVIGWIGACVNLGKPEKVAECAARGTCVNTSLADGGGTGGTPSDAKKDTDGPPFIEGTGHDTGTPALDVAPPTDDTATINPEIDAGELPDLPISDTPVPIIDDGSVPVDGPQSDQPTVIGDAPADGGKLDVPIFLDVRNDVPSSGPDTRDAPRDVAVGICAPGGVIQPAGTVCRPAVDLCDVAESCDGVNADCPADKLAAAGKECRASAGDCDIAETCSGTSATCPADGFKQAGAVCRAVAGVCDVAETCSGTGATCPLDALAPSGTVCRASTDGNKCDPAETCTGSSVSCPADVLYAMPGVPSGVTATAGTLQATIAWSAATGATGYNVKRSGTSGTGYTTLGTAPTTTASPYTDSGLTGGVTYYYVVSSINTIATCESVNSTEKPATPAGVCTPPAAPTITATPGNGLITISWTAVAGLTYTVARKITSGTADYANIAIGITTGSYPDSTAVYGTTYSYVVTASNGTCSSVNSNSVTSSPLCSPPATTPTGLAASTPSMGGQVTLTWTGSASAVTYQILRKLHTDTTYLQVGQVAGGTGTITFSDSGLTNGQAYDYVVTSNNGTCSSTASAPVTATPQCFVSPPVFATPATVGDKEVDLTWSVPAGAVNYTLSRKLNSDTTYAVITTPAITANSYADKDATLVNDTAYNYVVTANNGNCSSANSTAISATPHCTPPNPPGALTLTAGDTTINLSWVASTSNPTSYTVQRKFGAGSYTDLVTQAGTTYQDTGLTNGTAYSYQVRANKGSCSSGYDPAQSATPAPVCNQGPPGIPAATITPSTQVALTWTAASPQPSVNYTIGRSQSAAGTYTALGSGVSGTTLNYPDTDSSLVVGTTYFYEITANGSCSASSAPGSITLSCSTPGVPSPSASLNSNGSITVSWSTTTGATAYTVSRSTDGTTFTDIAAATWQTATNYIDTGVADGTVYYYKVRSGNANHQCQSAQSAPTTALRSCTFPAAPTGLSATRTGNKQVTLVWTNSTGTNNYSVQRGTTSGSESPLVTTAGTTYTDPVPSNTAAYYYVVKARSDSGGNCSSGNSAEVSVPACAELASGAANYQPNPQTTGAYCFVTCGTAIPTNDYNASNFDGRVLTVNGSTMTCPSSGQCTTNLPAQGNGGYVFQVAACPASGTCFAWSANSWWGNTTGNCP